MLMPLIAVWLMDRKMRSHVRRGLGTSRISDIVRAAHGDETQTLQMR